jgi:hypothetical protein
MAYLGNLKLQSEEGQLLSTEEMLERLHAAPSYALFNTVEAGIYISADPNLLRSWRWQQRGPPFEGTGHFVRYRKLALDEFLRGHVGRVMPDFARELEKVKAV